MVTDSGLSANIVRDPVTQQAELSINMGPQHPATHGVFRMVLTLDGERVVDVYPHIGYLHRGSERLAEGENFQQITTLFDRLDYVANFNNEWVYVRAVEKAMGVEVPERADYIRLILSELNRIASHLLFYGTYGLDTGAMNPVMIGFRDRERIQQIFEGVTGARMMHNYFRIGGVKEDLPDGFVPLCAPCWTNSRSDTKKHGAPSRRVRYSSNEPPASGRYQQRICLTTA